MIFDVIKTYIKFQEEVLCCSQLLIIPFMLKNWVLFSNLDNSRYVLIICVYDIELMAVFLGGPNNNTNDLYIYQPLGWYDARFWVSVAMSKLSFSNEDQCPAQCNENYQKTQNVVGVQKRMINMLGSVINETDDLIQSLSSSAFGDDLTKYQEISSLARKLSTVFSKLPWVNKEIGKMIMKMIKMEKEEYNSDFGDDDDFDDDDDDEDHSRPWPKPGPNRPRPNHLKYSLPNKCKLRYHYISLLFQIM